MDSVLQTRPASISRISLSLSIHTNQFSNPEDLEMKGSLLQILQSLLAKPKKPSPAAIADVYSRCGHVADLSNIISSGYFGVLWDFFHADVSNSHLELLLLCCAYDLSCRLSPAVRSLHTGRCIDMMLEDPSKLHTLLLRVLQATMVFREKDSKLQVAIFSFLRALVVESLVLFESALYLKWLESLVTYVQKNMTAEEIPSELFPVSEAFLSFALLCVSLDNTLGGLCKNSYLWVYFLGENHSFRTKRIAQLVFESCLQKVKFCTFVSAVDSLHLREKVSLVDCFLLYEVTATTLQEELTLLSSSEITELATKLIDCLRVAESVYVDVIAYCVAGSGLSLERLQDPVNFNEEDIFDLFEFHTLNLAPDILPYCGSFEIDEWMVHLRYQHAYQILRLFSERCLSVFSRIKVEDPAHAEGISGSSKYFAPVSSISVRGSIAHIKTKRALEFESGQFALLLELAKPNKHEATRRMILHGVNACRVARVVHQDDSLVVEWSASGYENRFNAVISLPKTFYPTGPIQKFPIQETNLSPEPEAKKRKVDDELSLNSALSGNILCIDAVGVENDVVNSILEKHPNTLVVFPTQSAVDLFEPREKCFRLDEKGADVYNLLEEKKRLLLRVDTLSGYLGLSEYAFSSSIKNALMLYESHVEPKWRSYVRHSSSSDAEYPFGKINAATPEEHSKRVILDFSEIRSLFSSLQKLSVLDMAEGDFATTKDYLLKTADAVIVSEVQLGQIERRFENVIVFNPLIAPFIPCSKLVIMNSNVPREIPHIASKRNTSAKPVQFLRTEKHPDVASLEEARYCMATYQFLRLQGIPRQKILLCCKTKYMKLLFQELLEEDSTFSGLGDASGAKPGAPILQEVDQLFPADHLIVAGEGQLGFQDMEELLLKQRKEVYIFSSEAKLPLVSLEKLKLNGLEIKDLSQLQRIVQKLLNDKL